MAREITYLSDVYLITCVVESGLADKIVDAATNVGAQGATINYARGTGIRDRMGLLGVTIDEQKEIIRIIVSKEQSNRIFEAMFSFTKVLRWLFPNHIICRPNSNPSICCCTTSIA